MPDRLSAPDAAFLHVERPGLPQHVGTVMVFAPVEGVPGEEVLERMAAHIEGRIAFVPRYRQRLRRVPAGLAPPVWVDDERFDIGYHVRLSALPRPGGEAQLADFAARVCARPLDRTRPLWEAYVVDAVAGGGVAVLTKTHQALVDGVGGLDLAQVVLDTAPGAPAAPAAPWRPAAEPSAAELVATAVLSGLARPDRAVAGARRRGGELRRTSGRLARGLVEVAAAGGPARGPLQAPSSSPHRRLATAATPLRDYQHVARSAGAGPHGLVPTVNDVVLAVLAGALRAWLRVLGRPPATADTLRALVPVSVPSRSGAVPGAPGGRPGGEAAADTGTPPTQGGVEQHVVDLPVGEPAPLARLRHIAFQLGPLGESGRAVPARELVELAGFAPATLHGLGARAASRMSGRMSDLVISNVPGPQRARWAAGARMAATWPVLPLHEGHALAVGVTSYEGTMFHGLHADFDAVEGLDALARAVPESLAELVGAAA